MKSFTTKGLLAFLFLTSITASKLFGQATVTINPPGLLTTTIVTGNTVNFTATRNAGANWPGGNGNYSYTWSSTGPAAVSFTNNPNTITGSSSSTVASGFTVTGTYNVICTVQEQGGGTTVISAAKIVNVLAAAPTTPNLWATSSDGTQVSSFVVTNGTRFAGPTNIFAPTFVNATNTYTRTAALGRNASPSLANGHFYWLGSSSGSNQNNGLVEVWASTATGTSQTRIGSLDLNDSDPDPNNNGNELGFVRLGIGPNGTGWILAGDGTTLYLAKFVTNGVNAVTITMEDASVALSGGSVGTFQNGDLCISGNNNIYALANDGSGVTQIFIGAPNGSSTLLTKKWDLVDPSGATFTGTVNGVAFDELGSIYISTSTGLFFIDQFSANGPAGTVQCALSWSVSGLQDLASNQFPTQSTLPVKMGSFTVNKQGTNAILEWNTITESNSDYFEIQRSTDGVNFVTVGTRAAAGNSNDPHSYQYSDPINTTAPVLYYRLNTVDVDRKASYSKIVSLKLGGGTIKNFTVFPNPFTTDLKLQVVSDKDADITIRINNALGQPVINRRVTIQKGENIIVLSSDLQTLKPGMHLMEIITDEGKTTQKIIKR